MLQIVYSKRLVRFLISGVSAAAVEYLSFLILHEYLAQQLAFSNVASFCAGLITSFLLNKTWVFKTKDDTGKQAIKYGLLALFNVTMSTIIILFAVSVVGIYGWIAKLVVMILIAAWNYLIFSKYIFKSNP